LCEFIVSEFKIKDYFKVCGVFVNNPPV